ncbi:beta-galactosidase [Candidatus Woesearchaeota archaeon]|nr:beta-galactosidase [Candidatus Woesearchaeota archaeon]
MASLKDKISTEMKRREFLKIFSSLVASPLITSHSFSEQSLSGGEREIYGYNLASLNYDLNTPLEELTKDIRLGEAHWPLIIKWMNPRIKDYSLEYIITGRNSGQSARIPAGNNTTFSPTSYGLGPDIYDVDLIATNPRTNRIYRQTFLWHFSAYGTPAVPQFKYGVNHAFTDTIERDNMGRLVEHMIDIGADALRLDFTWTNIEPNEGQFTFQAYDNVVSLLDSAGVRILPVLTYGNPWSNTVNDAKRLPDDIFYYQRYAAETVKHFRDFKFKIPMWQLWNEPNVPVHWKPKPDPLEYSTILHAGFIGIKYEDPGAVVVLSGLSGNGMEPNRHDLVPPESRVPANFIEDIYKLGMSRYFDVVAVHPYTNPVAEDERIGRLMGRIFQTYDVMRSYGDGDKPIWLTEMGWPELWYSNQDVLAEWLRTVYSLQNRGYIFDKMPVFWYTLRDIINPLPTSDDRKFGLLRADYSKTESYNAYKEVAGSAKKGK